MEYYHQSGFKTLKSPTWWTNITSQGLEYYDTHVYQPGDTEFSDEVIRWIKTAILMATNVKIETSWWNPDPWLPVKINGPKALFELIRNNVKNNVKYPHLTLELVQKFVKIFPGLLDKLREQEYEDLSLTGLTQTEQIAQKIKVESEINQIKKAAIESNFKPRQEAWSNQLTSFESQLEPNQNDAELKGAEERKDEATVLLPKKEPAAIQATVQLVRDEMAKLQNEKAAEILQSERAHEEKQKELREELEKANADLEAERLADERESVRQKNQKKEEQIEEFKNYVSQRGKNETPKLQKEQNFPTRRRLWFSWSSRVPANVSKSEQVSKPQNVLVRFIAQVHRNGSFTDESFQVLNNAILNLNHNLPNAESEETKQFWEEVTKKLQPRDGKNKLISKLEQFMDDFNVSQLL